jgi:uncharacterized protein (TIGR03435 family)
MTEQAARKLDLNRKALLGAAGLLAVAAPVVFGLLNATSSRAQSQSENAAANSRVFEVASIRPDKSDRGIVRIMFTPDGFDATNITLQMLIREACGVEDNQILGAPNWLGSENYDIEAKVDSSVADELQKLSGDQRKVAQQQMLQALLMDRVKLTLHHDTKQLPMYALVIAKNGPKLQEAKPGDTYTSGLKSPNGLPIGPGMMMMQLGGGQITAHGVPLADLVRQLTAQLGRAIMDKTGLTGKYDFTLKWTPDDGQSPLGGQPGPDNSPPPESWPSLFTALQEQLGLKLESQKGPVEVLVIDHVEKPSEN